MRAWKDFNEWRAESDPLSKMTAHDAVTAYERWKEEWNHEAAEEERARQEKAKEATAGPL